ncbi:VapE domain-containing protein [Winogradskyella sp. SYSU M77433]|uniref:VapE domain-containing protein n=1 Tax=Winogradskyella sp. SYSU M77433 TaxID=3042722 RepID=UPI00247FE063|nr:VapE domain-containing protein [Winogradskyella sp. SYSU M77433]MDH7912081.1 VapE family protein [Winogradskyella sp. SYSU M77433]
MLEKHLNDKYDFYYNEILSRVYYKEKKQDEYKLLSSYKLNSIKRELNNNDIKCSVSDLKSLLESDYVPKRNPFEEYFNSLPEWDNVDYLSELCKTVKTSNDQEYFWAFKKWIVAMVACALYPNITNQTIFIFTGKQGIGKTTWLKKLVPKKLNGYFFSGLINPSNKDTTLLMSEKLIVNLDELASLNNKQMDAFKEMVTKSVITERRAYAHFSEDYIRRASFVGSSNHYEILSDVTGNRRFLVFEAQDIDYECNIDMDKVYSQVMYILNNTDFQYHFVGDDITRIERNNMMYKQSNQLEDWIGDLFEKPSDDEKNIRYMSATDISLYISNNRRSYGKLNVQEIGKIMTSSDYARKKIKGSWKYVVITK